MSINIKTTDFDFSYTGSRYKEKDVVQKGIRKITGKELWEAIVNKKVFGDYPMGFKFIAEIYENGKVEGLNHVGSHGFGEWVIDVKNHTLSLKWNNGWINTITHAYEINGNIEFYDVDTGKWRTTFKKRVHLKKE